MDIHWEFFVSSVISLVGLIISFMTLNFRLRKDKREHQVNVENSLRLAIGDLDTRLDKKIEKMDQDFLCKIDKVEERVDDLEKKTFQTLLARLSGIEGQLKAYGNIVNLLQEKAMGGKD